VSIANFTEKKIKVINESVGTANGNSISATLCTKKGAHKSGECDGGPFGHHGESVRAAAEAAWLAPIHISTQHNAAAAVKIYVSIVANRIQRGWNMFLAVYGQWRCGRSAFTTAARA
jgi:hypothetical protein